MQLSPDAANDLVSRVEDGLSMFDFDADDAQGATDCPDGCQVEPDGHCRHGYLSAMETLLRVGA